MTTTGIPECEKILLVENLENLESWTLESGIQLKESGLSLTIEIQNSSFSDKDRNPVPGIQNPLRGLQNPKLSWIPFIYGANCINHERNFFSRTLA